MSGDDKPYVGGGSLPANVNERIQVADGEFLTIPEQIYVESRAAGMSRIASARAAGVGSYSNMEGKARVQEALQRLREEARAKAMITRDDVLEGFKDAVRSAATSTELTAAWREIGKFLGYYEERALEVKVEHTHKNQASELTEDKLRSLPLDELRRLQQVAGGDEVIDGEFEEVGDV